MKKFNFYTGCIIALLLPLFSVTKSLASGIALILGIFLISLSLISVPKNTNKIRKKTLNLAVILFGFGLNISSVISIGSKGLLQTAISLSIIILAGFLLANLFKLKNKSSQLIIFGTGICGGSAIAATAPVIDANDEEIAVSTGVVFILNTVALFLFSFLIKYLNLNATQAGIWSALSIHDTSSVISAAATHSNEALKIATIMKLTRTLWIIPMVIGLCIFTKSEKNKITFPTFILYFISATIISSTLHLPALYKFLTLIGKMLLSLSLYLIGTALNTNTLKKLSGKNLLFGITLWIVSIISGFLITIYL